VSCLGSDEQTAVAARVDNDVEGNMLPGSGALMVSCSAGLVVSWFVGMVVSCPDIFVGSGMVLPWKGTN
jgi:hypothetical protein